MLLILFTFVPIAEFEKSSDEGANGWKQMLSSGFFWTVMLMMLCAGASEQAVSQWASAFAEKGLGVTKQLGDIFGPMLFALCMGTSRAIYGIKGHKLDLGKFMYVSVMLCIAAYGVIIVSNNPVVTLLACGLVGFSVGIFWPGTFSLASAGMKGGTLMFALLALAGDLGCSAGPTLAGVVMSVSGQGMNIGIGAAVIFPIVMLLGLRFIRNKK